MNRAYARALSTIVSKEIAANQKKRRLLNSICFQLRTFEPNKPHVNAMWMVHVHIFYSITTLHNVSSKPWCFFSISHVTEVDTKTNWDMFFLFKWNNIRPRALEQLGKNSGKVFGQFSEEEKSSFYMKFRFRLKYYVLKPEKMMLSRHWTGHRWQR